MKGILCTCLISMFSVTMCACDLSATPNKSKSEEHVLSFSQTDESYGLKDELDASSDIFEGICVSKTVTERFCQADMMVRVEKTFRGSTCAGDLINVVGTDAYCYKEGGRCIFMTSKHASLFSGKPLFYSSAYPIYMNERGAWTCELQDLGEASFSEISAFIEEYVSSDPFNGDDTVTGKYCTSDELSEIVEYSDCIAVVVACDVSVEGLDRTCYECRVHKVLKGSMPNEAVIISFKDSMVLGDEYCVMLTEITDESGTVWRLSSRKSLIGAASADAAELYSLLG